jgi:ketosteroid isomerase-like protein
MKTQKLLVIILLSLFSFSNAFAQEDEKQKIKDLVKSFAKAYEGITDANDSETVLKYVSLNLRSTNVAANLMGKVNIDLANYENFRDYLDKIRGADGLKIDYKVKDIVNVEVRGNVASATYLVEYTFKKDGSVWNKGDETVSMVFVKEENQWKIVFFNFIGIEDERNRGACLCELFIASTGNYVAKTTVPAGKSYSTTLNNFEFKNDADGRIIKIEGKVYEWTKDNNIRLKGGVTTRDNKTPENLVTDAKTAEDAVKGILSKIIYKDNCTEFAYRRKN